MSSTLRATRSTRSSTRVTRNSTTSSNATMGFIMSQKLRAVSPEELESWQDDTLDSDSALEDDELDLDESWPYRFQVGQHVWIRTAGGNWHRGKVSGRARKGVTRHNREGLFYPVIFQNRIRKYFAPLNGDIKPDTPRVVERLKAGGKI